MTHILGEDLMPQLSIHAIRKLQDLTMPGKTLPLSIEDQKWFLAIYRAALNDMALAARVRALADVQTKQLNDKKRKFEKQQQKHREELAQGEVVPRSYHQELIAEELESKAKVERELRRVTCLLHELKEDSKRGHTNPS
jgi:hypothetical protein